MKNLETLIQELCPDGVEFRTMEEVFEIRNGYTPSKNNPDFWEGGTIPWFRMEDIRQNGRILSDAIQHITPAAIKGKGLFPANSIIIATTATIGEHALVIVDSLANQRFTNLTVRKSLSACLLPKFVFYYMFVIDEWCKKNVNAGNFASVDMKRFKKLDFPLPPIEVQTEIIHILDKFTSLEAELEVELDCRKRQYEYYRDKLLSFDNVEGQEVEWKKLNDIVIFKNGKGHEKSIVDEGKYIIVNSKFVSTNGMVRKYSDVQLCPLYKDSILMVMSDLPNGRALAKCFLVDKDDLYTLNQRVGSFVVNDNKVVVKFLFYILNRNRQLLQYDNGVDQTNLRKSDILNILIPIPSLAEQHRIVSILDRFESLTTSLQSGLPAEISARRQQYEHYRDKLLTFKRKGAV